MTKEEKIIKDYLASLFHFTSQFYDESLEISIFINMDICGIICWSVYEGRNTKDNPKSPIGTGTDRISLIRFLVNYLIINGKDCKQ